jgi:hypothetical protein
MALWMNEGYSVKIPGILEAIGTELKEGLPDECPSCGEPIVVDKAMFERIFDTGMMECRKCWGGLEMG